MRIKELFTIPEDQKATEQAFRRVLISTVCCITLCMVCLAGTTWAWFTVDIVNEGNEIQIASAYAQVTVNGQPMAQTRQTALSGENNICVRLEHSEKIWKSPVYVLMYITRMDASQCYYFTFLCGEGQEQYLKLPAMENASLSFQVSWIAPVGAEPVEELLKQLTNSADPEATEESQLPEETTIPTETTAPTEATVPTETTVPEGSVPPTTVPEETDAPEETTPPVESE